jgi:hypothetical protein
VLLGLTLALPAVALGQQSLPPNSAPPIPTPNNPPTNTSAPHPAMPWWPYAALDTGEPIGYIPVPPQQVTVEVLAPTPESLPARMDQQIVEIPGYLVTETTKGYLLPERWTLDHLNLGVYQWRRLPAEFRKK